MASTPTRQHRDPRLPHARCESRKVSYPDRADALDAAERLMDQGRVNPGCHLTPYRCPDCRRWHLFNRTIVFVDDPYRQARDLGE